MQPPGLSRVPGARITSDSGWVLAEFRTGVLSGVNCDGWGSRERAEKVRVTVPGLGGQGGQLASVASGQPWPRGRPSPQRLAPLGRAVKKLPVTTRQTAGVGALVDCFPKKFSLLMRCTNGGGGWSPSGGGVECSLRASSGRFWQAHSAATGLGTASRLRFSARVGSCSRTSRPCALNLATRRPSVCQIHAES